MKISIKKLQKIIKEEIENVLKEAWKGSDSSNPRVIRTWEHGFGSELTDTDDVYGWLNVIGTDLSSRLPPDTLRYADHLFHRTGYTVSNFLEEHGFQLPITSLGKAIRLFYEAKDLLMSKRTLPVKKTKEKQRAPERERKWEEAVAALPEDEVYDIVKTVSQLREAHWGEPAGRAEADNKELLQRFKEELVSLIKFVNPNVSKVGISKITDEKNLKKLAYELKDDYDSVHTDEEEIAAGYKFVEKYVELTSKF